MSSLLVVFAVLYIAIVCVARFLASSGHKFITWSSGNWRFYANCIFVLAISVFLPLIVSFFVDWCPLDYNYLFVFFVLSVGVFDINCFFFLAVGVLLPPIVIFSLLLRGLASFDSNSLFFFVLF